LSVCQCCEADELLTELKVCGACLRKVFDSVVSTAEGGATRAERAERRVTEPWANAGLRNRQYAIETKEAVLNGTLRNTGDLDVNRIWHYHELTAELEVIPAGLGDSFEISWPQYGAMRLRSRSALSLLVLLPQLHAPLSNDADGKPGYWPDDECFVANFAELRDGDAVTKSRPGWARPRSIPRDSFVKTTIGKFGDLVEIHWQAAAQHCFEADMRSHLRDDHDNVTPCRCPRGFDWRARLR
jgi:hypothetical protein